MLFLFFLTFELYFLILLVIALIFINTLEIAIRTGTPTNEANTEIENTTTNSRNII